MAEFLETTGISHEITKLIRNSEDKLFLISPYLQIADSLRHLIKERDIRRIDLRIIYRKDNKINADDISFLQELTSIKILACENLHAKCYLNENTAIITSMNLYEYSQQNNREMGIKIEKSVDKKLYEDISEEVKAILQTSQPIPFSIKKMDVPLRESLKNTVLKSDKLDGFCIRCGKEIKLNQKKPFCIDCYTGWEKYRNADYEEKFCHGCKKENISTMNKPFCLKCFKRLNPK